MDIYRFLDEKAPYAYQADFDNSGFLVGRGEAEVKRLLVALDVTEEVVDEACLGRALELLARLACRLAGRTD